MAMARELTLRERWLSGEDVVYDPLVDLAIDMLPDIFAKMDIEHRAWFCGLSDRMRMGFIISLVRQIRDNGEHMLLYGKPKP